MIMSIMQYNLVLSKFQCGAWVASAAP